MKSTCMHSQAQGSDADSTVPLYLPSTHWQLVEPVTVVKLCSGQDAHGSLLYPSLNVPLGHSVKGEAKTHTIQNIRLALYTAVCKTVVATVSINSRLTTHETHLWTFTPLLVVSLEKTWCQVGVKVQRRVVSRRTISTTILQTAASHQIPFVLCSKQRKHMHTMSRCQNKRKFNSIHTYTSPIH